VTLQRLIDLWYIKVVLPRLEPQFHYQSGAHETGWYFAELQNRGVIICTATIRDGEIVFDNRKVLAKLSEEARLKYLEYVHEVLDPWLTGDLRKFMDAGFVDSEPDETP
jgi:hypothetical protein